MKKKTDQNKKNGKERFLHEFDIIINIINILFISISKKTNKTFKDISNSIIPM
jgi:hypothetical protein